MDNYALGAGLLAMSPDIGVVAQNHADLAMQNMKQAFQGQVDAGKQAYQTYLANLHETAAQNRATQAQKSTAGQTAAKLKVESGWHAESNSARVTHYKAMEGDAAGRLKVAQTRAAASTGNSVKGQIGNLQKAMTYNENQLKTLQAADSNSVNPQNAASIAGVQENIKSLGSQLKALGVPGYGTPPAGTGGAADFPGSTPVPVPSTPGSATGRQQLIPTSQNPQAKAPPAGVQPPASPAPPPTPTPPLSGPGSQNMLPGMPGSPPPASPQASAPQPQQVPAPAQAKAPYPEGTKLMGQDGKQYIVQNGVPVPYGG